MQCIINDENVTLLQEDNDILITHYENGNLLLHSDESDAIIMISAESDDVLERKIYNVFLQTLETIFGRFVLKGSEQRKLPKDFVDLNEKSIKINSLYPNACIELLYQDNNIALSIHKESLDSTKGVTVVTDGIKYFGYSDIFWQMYADLLNTVYSHNMETSTQSIQKEYLS